MKKKTIFLVYMLLSGFILLTGFSNEPQQPEYEYADTIQGNENADQIDFTPIVKPVSEFVTNAMYEANDHALPQTSKQWASSIIGGLLLLGISWAQRRIKENRKNRN